MEKSAPGYCYRIHERQTAVLYPVAPNMAFIHTLSFFVLILEVSTTPWFYTDVM